MPSPAIDVAWYLNTKNVGTTSASTSATSWPIKVGKLFDSPDAQIALYDTGGSTPNTKWLIDFVTVQAVVRGVKNGYSAAYAKCENIKDALLGVDAQEVGMPGSKVWWSGIEMMGDIIFLGYDANDRPKFSANFKIMRESPKSALSNREPLDYTGP